MKNKYLQLFLLILCTNLTLAQQPSKPNTVDIYQAIKKLNFLGSALYIAAHPDDENTRLISYLENSMYVRTGYLSLTRGDGGQNLIGSELRELLGVIRTQELLAARRIDGGDQFFTRANDFGYSKQPNETFSIWDKDQVLQDVVWTIRQSKPDIIINRFDHRTPGTTHGHHTGSAMLSVEAFELANNKSSYTNQLKLTETWQPKRLFYNTSWWAYGGKEVFDEIDKSHLIKLNTGVFYPHKGLSNNEVAALSRSEHKSQGFGSTGSRGDDFEYLELLKDVNNNKNTDLFYGIDTSWNRVKGGAQIGNILYDVEKNFNFNNPSASINKLIEAYHLIQKLDDPHWRTIKSEEIKDIILACAGLYLEAVTNEASVTPNEKINVTIEAINRSNIDIQLKSFSINESIYHKNINLSKNKDFTFKESYQIPNNEESSTPYWLIEKGTLGMYNVKDQSLIGKAQSPSKTNATFTLQINNTNITFTKPVIYKTNDPVQGEVYQPFVIIPEVSSKIGHKILIFEDEKPKKIKVLVTAGRNDINGTLSINHPKEWTVSPESQPITIENKGQQKSYTFTVTPPNKQNEAYFSPQITINNKTYNQELINIDYAHIPNQSIVLPNASKLVRLNIQKKGNNIGYINGAGDLIPESLQQIGYHVTLINPNEITAEHLKKFDAIVLGIRAFNTIDELKFKQNILFDYVKNGGNLITQYNTNHRLVTEQIAPFDLKLSRDRVTNENATVTFLTPNHPVLNTPNKITLKDFNDWTQERGLYFPSQWDSTFTPILAMNDDGENPLKGSLLVAQYGKGYYVYTGLSFFRELPAGVPGAYRLFANLISLGK